VIKYHIKPQTRRYTTLRNITVRKTATTWNMFTGIMINDTLQRSAATWFRCGESFDHHFTTNLLLSLFWKKSLNIWQSYGGKVDCVKRCAEKWGTRSRSDVWRTRTVVEHRIITRLILVINLDSVIDKCQTGVMSTTCDSPTDAFTDWMLTVHAGVLSRRLSTCLMDMRTFGRSAGFSVWSL